MPRSFLTDAMWEKLAALLPPEKGETGRPNHEHRPWIEAILWKHRTGAPWRDIPGEFVRWKSIYSRFNRWSKVGMWQAVLEVLREDADTEWVMIDSTVIRAHQHAAGAEKGGSRTRLSGDLGADCRRKCT